MVDCNAGSAICEGGSAICEASAKSEPIPSANAECEGGNTISVGNCAGAVLELANSCDIGTLT